jgi:protein-serine/threonine kinase
MDNSSAGLHVPDPHAPTAGPSKPAARSASIAVQPNSSSTQVSPRKARASHAVTSSDQRQHQSSGDHHHQPTYHDVYSHPAAVAYTAAHPRRQIPKFGPYLLLQTLGEGEFGKVKLGLHSQWGEEVAVKLIRKGSAEAAVRMGKVEREIEVLRVRVPFPDSFRCVVSNLILCL